MAKREEPAYTYVCMMPRLRRVSHPHEERIVIRKTRLRRLLSKLALARHG
jgi:hypothetical protein